MLKILSLLSGVSMSWVMQYEVASRVSLIKQALRKYCVFNIVRLASFCSWLSGIELDRDIYDLARCTYAFLSIKPGSCAFSIHGNQDYFGIVRGVFDWG